MEKEVKTKKEEILNVKVEFDKKVEEFTFTLTKEELERLRKLES